MKKNIVSTTLSHFSRILFLFCVSAVIFLTALPGISRDKLHDNLLREYNIRNTDPEEVDGSNRKLFKTARFSLQAGEADVQGRPAYTVRREEVTDRGDKVIWKLYADPEDLSIIKLERQVISREGLLIEDTTQIYSNHYYEYPSPTCHSEMLPFIAQYLDLQEGSINLINLIWGPEQKPWDISFTSEGRESISVPAGDFDCVRLKVVYSLDDLPGFFKILPSFLLKRMFTDSFMWVQADPPHAMIRFQGKFEGMSAPEKVQELVGIHAE